MTCLHRQHIGHPHIRVRRTSTLVPCSVITVVRVRLPVSACVGLVAMCINRLNHTSKSDAKHSLVESLCMLACRQTVLQVAEADTRTVLGACCVAASRFLSKLDCCAAQLQGIASMQEMSPHEQESCGMCQGTGLRP
jgi:hypothetical protein